ncbi:MAG: rod shape-determining protein MreC [Bryobacteraceae bacterium]
MEFILNRYKNVTVLSLVLGAQLFLLAWQVRTRQDVELIRVWSVSGFMPVARLIEGVRANTIGVLDNYADLARAADHNRQLQQELDKLKLENQYLRTELATADRARALALFLQKSPNRYLAARVVGAGTGAGAKVVLVDRGTNDGVKKGMAVITPDGIVGKISAAYPSGSQVLLVFDGTFAAGVISQKNRVHGTLKGQGSPLCTVEYIQNEEKLEVGEWLFTSGDDRVFPKGLPVGRVKTVRPGKIFYKEVFVEPSGLQRGLEEVLVVLEGVHQQIPDALDASQALHMLPPPPPEPKSAAEADRAARKTLSTEADKVMERHKGIPAPAAAGSSAPAPSEGAQAAPPPPETGSGQQ